ncbi:MAG: hypothetical protein ABSD73_02060 [Candidatus Bathyarchaeia archaeon]|jgi:hypothetical protein
MPKEFKAFRFNSQLYASFKELASKNGYTVTGALEKFMSSAVEHGLVFPSTAQLEDVEREARIMLTWLRKGDNWVNLDGKEETSTKGRLLALLTKVKDAALKTQITEALEKS